MQWRGHSYEMWQTDNGWYFIMSYSEEAPVTSLSKEHGPFATEGEAGDAIDEFIDKNTSCSGRV